MSYDHQFYSELLMDTSSHVTLIGFVGESPVAAICIMKNNENLYVKTITVSPSFRGRGLGSQIFHKGIEVAKPSSSASIHLHVWVKNIIACQFYTSLGFEIVKLEPSYYSRLSPSGAWELKSTVEQLKRKTLDNSRALAASNTNNIPFGSPDNLSLFVEQAIWGHTARDPPYA